MKFILWVVLITNVPGQAPTTSQAAALFDTHDACANALALLKAEIETPGSLSKPIVIVKGSCLPTAK